MPLLLGWLGAYAFVLRKITKEISENSFGKSSALRHIVRLLLRPIEVISFAALIPRESVSFIQTSQGRINRAWGFCRIRFDLAPDVGVSGWARHLDRAADSGLRLPAVWEQFLDAAVQVRWQSCQHVLQIGPRVMAM